MDYCSTCRRHLNGALVCPGCGAYAPDIAPVTTGGRAVPAPRVTMAAASAAGARDVPLPDAWRETSRPGDDAAPATGEPTAVQDDPADDAPGGPADTVPVRAGRAARRRRRAQWKKTQRRALVATAVALVGGGLTVASMDRHTGDQAQAATGPEIAGAVGEEPADGTVPSSSHPTGRRSPAAPGPQSPTTGHRHHPSAPAPRPAAANSLPDTPVPPAPTAPTIAPSVPQQPGTTVPSSADAGAGSGRPAGTAQQTPPPVPPAAGGTDLETPPSTGSASDPTNSPTSPSQLCLLVLCIS